MEGREKFSPISTTQEKPDTAHKERDCSLKMLFNFKKTQQKIDSHPGIWGIKTLLEGCIIGKKIFVHIFI